MGIVNGRLTLRNPRLGNLDAMEISAMADTGALFLCIPEHIRVQLRLETLEHREVTLADGSRRMVPYVGPIEVRFKTRAGYFGALVMGDQVLLGAIPMEDLDLVVIPKTQTVDVNPENPNMAACVAKGMRRYAASASSRASGS